MTTIAILFGGRSSEYEVALSSAYGALKNIDRSRYNVIRIGIEKTGTFWYYCDSDEKISDGSWTEGEKYPVSVDLTNHGLLIDKNGSFERLHVDKVLPMIHGKFCEDGTMQGLFAVAGIPMAGCDCASSAICMDKAVAKEIVEAETDIRQALAVVANISDITSSDGEYDTEKISAIRKASEKKLGYPLFIKPSRAGSSVGASKVKSAAGFESALLTAFAEDTKVLIEECIVGREIEVAVLEENHTLTAAGPAEIDIGSSEFYDYETKYISDASSYYIPARIPEEKRAEVREKAKQIFRALGCSGYSRVDFFIRRSGELVFNEINTLPGFTPISMYPKMMIENGLSYSEVLDKILG